MAQVIIIAQGIEIRDAGQGTALRNFLSTQCDAKKGSVWTYPKGAGAKATHEIRVVFDMTGLTSALDTADSFVVYEGHSRYGQGPAFGPSGIGKVPDKKLFPVNPWGVHFRMGFDATDTECIADLMHHSVSPAEYDLVASGAKAFLPTVLVSAAKNAKDQDAAIKKKKVKAKAVCGLSGAWRLFDSCAATLATTATARGDTPLKGRHFYARIPKKPDDEFMTAVSVGSANLDAAKLSCKLFFMASCSSEVHFKSPLLRRRKTIKSACKFLLTAQICATSHATTFLEQVLVKGNDPMTKVGMKGLLKALNGVSNSGIVGLF